MKKSILILTIVTICLLGLPIFTQGLVEKSSAQENQTDEKKEEKEQTPETAAGLPLTYELKGQRGQTLSETTSVTNFQKETMKVQVGVLDFEVVSEEGGIRFTNVVSDDHKLASWINIDRPTFTLAKNETRQVDFTVKIPENAVPGAHWAMMFFQGFDERGEKQFENLGGAGALILVTVRGTGVVGKGEVKGFSIFRNDERKSLISALRVSNVGNDFIKPKGTITVYNTWGAKVDEVPLNLVIVFSGTISKILTEWQPKDLQMGRYKMVVNGFYGSKNEEFNAQTSIWILPWQTKYIWYFLSGIGVIVLLFIIFKIFKLEIKRKPKRIPPATGYR